MKRFNMLTLIKAAAHPTQRRDVFTREPSRFRRSGGTGAATTFPGLAIRMARMDPAPAEVTMTELDHRRRCS
jgi:hypothetical protein